MEDNEREGEMLLEDGTRRLLRTLERELLGQQDKNLIKEYSLPPSSTFKIGVSLNVCPLGFQNF